MDDKRCWCDRFVGNVNVGVELWAVISDVGRKVWAELTHNGVVVSKTGPETCTRTEERGWNCQEVGP